MTKKGLECPDGRNSLDYEVAEFVIRSKVQILIAIT